MNKQSTAIICLSHHSGGMEIDSIKLAKKLSAHVPITLIAKTNCFIAKSKDDYAGYNNIELETVSFRSSMSLSIVLGVRRIVREKGIKNVIFFGASELKSLYFSFLGLDVNLIIRHGTTKSTPKKDWFHRLIYSNVNYHVAICKHLQKNVEQIIPFGKETRSILIYPSFEFEDEYKMPHEKLTLLHVGRIVPGKGQGDAIEACRVLYENGIDFVFYLVGGFNAKYKARFMEQYASLPYKDKIVLAGFTTNVAAYYAKSDIFLFPSYGEGFGNAFVEALGNGLVCICYNNTSFPEFRALGCHFHLAGNKDVHGLCSELLHVSKNIKNETKLSQPNVSLVKDLFVVKREVEQYLEILD